MAAATSDWKTHTSRYVICASYVLTTHAYNTCLYLLVLYMS